jgi:rSAM/selenodomain-associated transferase 2
MQSLGPCLAALTEGLEDGLIAALIISDGGSTDGVGALADAAGAKFISGPAGRGQQLGAGAAESRSAWMLFLHADTILAPGWSIAVRKHIASSANKAGYFQLKLEAPGLAARIIAGGANLRSRWFGLPYGDQGLLISRALYDEIGGYPAQSLMEDVAIVRRLRGRLAAMPAIAATSAARYQRDGWLRRPARNLWLLSRYLLGADPEKLAAAYRASSAN